MRSVIVFIMLMLTIYSCSDSERNNQGRCDSEKSIIEQTIRNTIGWAKDKDTSLLYSIIAADSSYLEVHPGNNVVFGFENFKRSESFWLDPRFKHVGFDTWDMHINLSKDGTVAWFYCMLDDLNTWDGKPANWENTRWTGVLEKRNGKWQMVQMHFSKPGN